ncbi:Protein of unknown function [Lachnospiraceae bacterium XBB1006]|nr:Protein of unknown function [Lachnospiraceae bacterium XBB1006]
MPEEIQEAVQIIRVAYDGIEIAMKVGSGGIGTIKKVVGVIKGLLDYEKSLGKTSMRKLLKRGGDLQVLQFKTSDMSKVKKMAKKYGILYSVLPDVNPEDGLSEIIFHAEAVPRANMILQKLKSDQAKVKSFEEYVRENGGSKADKLINFFRRQKKVADKEQDIDGVEINTTLDNLIEKVGNYAIDEEKVTLDGIKENFSIDRVEAESVLKRLITMGLLSKGDGTGKHTVLMDKEAFEKRIRGYRDLAERMRAVAKSKDMNLADVTISKTLIAKESDTAVKTRVPGTWGENVRYVWLKKENIMDIYNGKTMLTFLEKSKDYKLYDAENRVVEVIKGEELYNKHYDQVEAAVRERYEQVKKDKTITTTKAKRR